MSLYKSSGIRPPTTKQIEDLANNHNLHVSKEDAEQFKGLIGDFLEAYDRIDEMVADQLPIKYARTGGYKPERSENKHNAWYYKCDIRGAADGKLSGKKMAIKDNIMVAGVPMINGSQYLAGYVPDEDATVVTRVLDEGAHILGKANCENLCFSGSSNTCAAGIVPNPIDPTRSAGGSSSGCAVLLQTGEVDMAIGGDQGGSVRTPSSWCGTVAIKATHGLVPYTGAMPIEPSIDHLGPMTRTVQDCAVLLEVLAGYDDKRDPRQSHDLKTEAYSQKLTGKIAGVRIGFLKEGFTCCEKDVASLIQATQPVFQALGATVTDVSVPEHCQAYDLWIPIANEGAYKCMMEHGGAMIGQKGHQNVASVEQLRAGIQSKKSVMPASVKVMYMLGAYVTENYGMSYYAKAQSILPRILKAFDKAFKDYDVLVMPTLPYTAPKFPLADSSLKDLTQHFADMEPNTAPYDLTGHPAMTVNAGYIEKLPVGLQIVGNHWNEAMVLNVAYAFEQEMLKTLKP